MSISSHIKHTIGAIALSVISISSASAAIIWDYSPDTTGGSGQTNWSNGSSGQNFLELVTFANAGSITSMDIYGGLNFGQIGDAVTIKIFTDNVGAPGSIVTTFNEIISIVDTEGTSSVATAQRLHADFTNAYNYSAGSFWIGMSGVNGLVQMGLQNNSPADGMMWQLSNNTPSHIANVGDMAFRLHSGENNVNDVPEPAPLALLGLGLVGLGLLRKRKA